MSTTTTHYASTTGLKVIGFLLPFSDPCAAYTNLSQQTLEVSALLVLLHMITPPHQSSLHAKRRRPSIFVCSIFFVLFHRRRIQNMTFLRNTVYISDFITCEGNVYLTLGPEKKNFSLYCWQILVTKYSVHFDRTRLKVVVSGILIHFSTRIIFWSVTASLTLILLTWRIG